MLRSALLRLLLGLLLLLLLLHRLLHLLGGLVQTLERLVLVILRGLPRLLLLQLAAGLLLVLRGLLNGLLGVGQFGESLCRLLGDLLGRLLVLRQLLDILSAAPASAA